MTWNQGHPSDFIKDMLKPVPNLESGNNCDLKIWCPPTISASPGNASKCEFVGHIRVLLHQKLRWDPVTCTLADLWDTLKFEIQYSIRLQPQ